MKCRCLGCVITVEWLIQGLCYLGLCHPKATMDLKFLSIDVHLLGAERLDRLWPSMCVLSHTTVLVSTSCRPPVDGCTHIASTYGHVFIYTHT